MLKNAVYLNLFGSLFCEVVLCGEGGGRVLLILIVFLLSCVHFCLSVMIPVPSTHGTICWSMVCGLWYVVCA